jgi:hypothetical protein
VAVYGPVHVLPYDPQYHELFAIYQIRHNIRKREDVPNALIGSNRFHAFDWEIEPYVVRKVNDLSGVATIGYMCEMISFDLLCLTSLSAIIQLYHGD